MTATTMRALVVCLAALVCSAPRPEGEVRLSPAPLTFGALHSLETGCSISDVDETRLWILRDHQPRYLLVLRGSRSDATVGAFWKLAGTTSCALHEYHAYHWAGVAAGVNSPGAIASTYREPGERSSMTLTIERCEAESYERIAYGPVSDLPDSVRGAVATIVGYIMRLAAAAEEGCPEG